MKNNVIPRTAVKITAKCKTKICNFNAGDIVTAYREYSYGADKWFTDENGTTYQAQILIDLFRNPELFEILSIERGTVAHYTDYYKDPLFIDRPCIIADKQTGEEWQGSIKTIPEQLNGRTVINILNRDYGTPTYIVA